MRCVCVCVCVTEMVRENIKWGEKYQREKGKKGEG